MMSRLLVLPFSRMLPNLDSQELTFHDDHVILAMFQALKAKGYRGKLNSKSWLRQVGSAVWLPTQRCDPDLLS